MTNPKSKTPAARWKQYCSDAYEALSRLKEVQEEYQDWYDDMSDSQQESGTGEQVQAVTEIDIEELLSNVEDAQNLDLPTRFGGGK